MTTLSNKIKNNIEFLLKLKEEDNVHANKCSLIDQTEYVQINNDLEIEYAIYITLTELLGEERILINVDYKYDDIINIIDKCITNIYDNKQLNLLIEKSDTFNSMINHIEDLFDNMKDKVFYYSLFGKNFYKYFLLNILFCFLLSLLSKSFHFYF